MKKLKTLPKFIIGFHVFEIDFYTYFIYLFIYLYEYQKGKIITC